MGDNFSLFGTNFMDKELTQCLVSFSVSFSPLNSWPRCAPQLLHWIFTLSPSESGILFKEFGYSSSNEGQPHPASNLASDEKRG